MGSAADKYLTQQRYLDKDKTWKTKRLFEYRKCFTEGKFIMEDPEKVLNIIGITYLTKDGKSGINGQPQLSLSLDASHFQPVTHYSWIFDMFVPPKHPVQVKPGKKLIFLKTL